MTVESVSAEELERAIREVASENPDFVYRKAFVDDGPPICAYFDEEGCPSCLVGHGLARLGMGKDDIKDLNFVSVEALFDDGIIETGDTPKSWFNNVQEFQDTDTPWGQTVRDADMMLRESEDD